MGCIPRQSDYVDHAPRQDRRDEANLLDTIKWGSSFGWWFLSRLVPEKFDCAGCDLAALTALYLAHVYQ